MHTLDRCEYSQYGDQARTLTGDETTPLSSALVETNTVDVVIDELRVVMRTARAVAGHMPDIQAMYENEAQSAPDVSRLDAKDPDRIFAEIAARDREERRSTFRIYEIDESEAPDGKRFVPAIVIEANKPNIDLLTTCPGTYVFEKGLAVTTDGFRSYVDKMTVVKDQQGGSKRVHHELVRWDPMIPESGLEKRPDEVRDLQRLVEVASAKLNRICVELNIDVTED